jgi:hypothetical protein
MRNSMGILGVVDSVRIFRRQPNRTFRLDYVVIPTNLLPFYEVRTITIGKMIWSVDAIVRCDGNLGSLYRPSDGRQFNTTEMGDEILIEVVSRNKSLHPNQERLFVGALIGDLGGL